MSIDWNAVVHILDQLSDGTHSLFELSYMAERYETGVFVESLLFLADRSLVELSEGAPLLRLPNDAWSQRLLDAFSTEPFDEGLLVRTSIDLSHKGEQVLRLFNTGHPPLSGAGEGS